MIVTLLQLRKRVIKYYSSFCFEHTLQRNNHNDVFKHTGSVGKQEVCTFEIRPFFVHRNNLVY